MRVYEKNRRWYLEGMVRGKRYHQAIPEATDKASAEKYLTIFKADLLRGRLELVENIGQKPFITLIPLYKDYAANLKSSYTVIKMADKFGEEWKNKRICDITPSLIEKYKNKRKETVYYKKEEGDIKIEKRISPDTINRELGVLSKMFNLAIDNGLTNENPVAKVKKLKVPNKKERHLSLAEEDRILKVCDGDYSFMGLSPEELLRLKKRYKSYHKRLKPIILIALYTGMRKSEILTMPWDCVDLDRKELTVLNPKNDIAHTLPLSDRLYEILTEMKTADPDSKYIFTNHATNTYYKNADRSFRTVLKLANVKNFRFHDLRHTAATRLIALGVPVPVVQAILNHKKIQTTMRYAHPMKEQKISALEKLSNYGKNYEDIN